MAWLDILTNVVSDIIFVFLVTLVLGLAILIFSYGRLGKARRFFGFGRDARISIYVSGFEHPGVKTKRVVNALEYEVAVGLRDALRRVSGQGFLQRLTQYLAGLIGQEVRSPEANIEVSPLEVTEVLSCDGVILVGGPVGNQLSRFYLQGSPQFRFDEGRSVYQQRDADGYRDMSPSDDVAIIEKRLFGGQVVLLIHGFGEEQTQRAAEYLIKYWERLYKLHRTREFAIHV